MFGLLEDSNVNAPLHKTVIYSQLVMDSAEREKFDADISRIAIVNRITSRHIAEGKDVNAMTFTLLTTKEGKKMGKTEQGTLWVARDKTTP